MRAGDFDVAVVGASVAGCTAARRFAQAGARVALIERRPDPAAYKVVCTHAVLPGANDAIERLGLAPLLETRGALRTQAEFWTPYSGWVGFPPDAPDGWGVTRKTLDPMLRDLTVGTEGVELFAGWRASAMLESDGQVTGVEATDSSRRTLTVRARLVVGADGRDSTVARLARVPGRVRPHNRFFYFAYWRGLRPVTTANRVWLVDPHGAAQFPNEDDLTVLVAAPHRDRMAEFRANPEDCYVRMMASLPDIPDLSGAERVSKLIGKLEVPNVIRPAASRGMAFVGDAALATDPVFGVGLTFAFTSAEWLVDETAAALVEGRELDKGLARYRRKFLWRLGPHHVQIADYSTGRRLRPMEKATFRAASEDPAVALAFGEVIARVRSPLRLLAPGFNARVLLSSWRASSWRARTALGSEVSGRGLSDVQVDAEQDQRPQDHGEHGRGDGLDRIGVREVMM